MIANLNAKATLRILWFVKGEHRYAWHFPDDPRCRVALLRHFGKCASDAELNFNWLDAAGLAAKVKGGAA